MKSALATVLATSLGLALADELSVLRATDVAKGGKMVVAVRFKDGLVACADKRSHLDGPGLPKNDYRNDDVKITLVKGL